MAQVRTSAETIPPQALEAELAVLGAMMLDRDSIAKGLEIIDDTCFYMSQNARIFNCMISLDDRNEAVDLITRNLSSSPYFAQVRRESSRSVEGGKAVEFKLRCQVLRCAFGQE